MGHSRKERIGGSDPEENAQGSRKRNKNKEQNKLVLCDDVEALFKIVLGAYCVKMGASRPEFGIDHLSSSPSECACLAASSSARPIIRAKRRDSRVIP